jgi:hypothetical protein
MLLIDNFLVLFSLETGGQFIGLFCMITQGLIFCLFLTLLIMVSLDKDMKSFTRNLDNYDIHALDDRTNDELIRLRSGLMFILVIGVIISLMIFFVAFLLVRGVKQVSFS